MSTDATISTSKQPRSPASSDVDVDAELKQFEAEERERLGLDGRAPSTGSTTWSTRSSPREQREHTTLLVGGPDHGARPVHRGRAHAASATRSRCIDVPDNDALRYGKEFGNRGQCNPTYFTVGNLVKYLIDAARQAAA